VSLNSIMVDGTGMCGSCRVTVGGKMRFACIDGADFDGHLVNFDELALRQKRFEREEKAALERFRANPRSWPAQKAPRGMSQLSFRRVSCPNRLNPRDLWSPKTSKPFRKSERGCPSSRPLNVSITSTR
jgi:hypothetical protein